MKRLLLYIPIILIFGCKEDFPVYSTFCSDKKLINCLRYDMLIKEKDKKILEKNFGLKDDSKCAYLLQLTRYHVGECNNPIVKSTGSDFDGYVRIQINKGMGCYYKVQSDYKNDLDGAFERVLKQAKKDL